MNIEVNIENKNIQLNSIIFQKMLFLYNALDEGWAVEKKNNNYVFTKKHEGKKEVFLDSYLQTFMQSNMDISKILNSTS